VLVSGEGKVLFEDHNHTSGGDHTRHPEFDNRAVGSDSHDAGTARTGGVYTSGEHCPMCAAAHGWVGLGKIVYAASSAQFAQWVGEFGGGTGPVKTLPIEAILVSPEVEGPEPTLTERLRSLHQRRFEAGGYGNS
jgi:tRNA(Arg) A34 adenosine deaminase TadA